MAVEMYMRLCYDDYKALEEQLKNFKQLETTHTSMGEENNQFYHNAIRLRFGPDLVIEVQGPLVKEPLRG